jgi:hypothetical protein
MIVKHDNSNIFYVSFSLVIWALSSYNFDFFKISLAIGQVRVPAAALIPALVGKALLQQYSIYFFPGIILENL